VTRHRTTPSAATKRATPEERQARIERVAELINKYHLTCKVIGQRLGISERSAVSDRFEAKRQGLIK
jgi:DNA-binding transcriptional regulator LsrR (DeoR family)